VNADDQSIVWVDGAWVPASRATIAVDRWNPWLAISLAESIVVESGRPLYVRDHLARLAEGCRALAWLAPDLRLLTRVLRRLPALNRLKKGGLRLRWWGGDAKPLFIAQPVAAPAPGPDAIRLLTTAVRHYGPDSLNGRAKVAHMLPNWLARAEVDAWAEDGLRLTPDGFVAEGVWTNIVALKRKIARTPPLSLGLLEGVTRSRFLKQLRAKGWQTREEPLTRYDLWTADRVWVTSSLRGALPVLSVDGRPLATK